MARRRSIVLVAVGLAAAVAAAGVRADGLPVIGIDAGPEGVAAADVRFVTLPARDGTVVARVRLDGGAVERSRYLPGSHAIPVVAYDGPASGVSADGRTLVVIEPRETFPRKTTSLSVLDAGTLKPLQRIRLDGDFSFDALSPDGALLYLIEYVAPQDPTRYAVRVLDLESGRLLPEAVVDPDEPPDAMRGSPITRATSPDGRIAYTLYDGAGGHPFIHALDTQARTAACIDLDHLLGRQDLYDLRLSVSADGSTVGVHEVSGRAVAVVDAATHEVSELPEPPPAAVEPVAGGAATANAPVGRAARPQEHDGGRDVPWAAVAVAAGGALAVALVAFLLVRRRHAAGARTPAV